MGLSEPARRRRDFASRFGADVVYDPAFPGMDVPARVTQATGGRGADVVFECAGSQPTLDAAVKAVRAKGTIVNIALWHKPATIDFNTLMVKEAFITS